MRVADNDRHDTNKPRAMHGTAAYSIHVFDLDNF